MESSVKLTKKPKRTFSVAWLSDVRYKSWIREVPSDNTLYYCTICDKSFSCGSTHISRHAESAHHKNNSNKNCSSDDDSFLEKKSRRSIFQQKWLDRAEFKSWLREVPHDPSLFFCLMCDKSAAGGLSQIIRHSKSKAHINKNKTNSIEVSQSNNNSQSNDDTQATHNRATQTELLSSFEERKKSAEIRFAAFIADKNIPHQNAKEILSFFRHVGEDPNVLKAMSMGRTKCKNIITNVLCPIETERVVNKIQNTKFTIFINETSDNEKWMTFLVRYVDPDTLDIRSQLVKLIDIDAKDSNAEKLFLAFKCEMWKLQILFLNIVALSCDSASTMTGKHLLFKEKLEEECPHLLTFSCPCYATMLAVHAACNEIPIACEEFITKIGDYINCSPKCSSVFSEFCEYFQENNNRLSRLNDTRWRSHYLCVKKLLESWDTIKHFLNQISVNEKTRAEECLLSMMDNIELKAYFLFLEYTLNFFNKFNTFFQALDTRIHILQPKSLNFLLQICQNFLKEKHLKPFSKNVVFSLQENQKDLHQITLGLECEKYLQKLMEHGHEDEVETIRKNCLKFYVTAAENIRKTLPVDNVFLSKLQVFKPSLHLFDNDRETSFADVSFVAQTIGGFDEDGLKKEWIVLSSDFTTNEKQSLSKLNFDNMWKKILRSSYPNNMAKYPNLINILNAIRSLPNSNSDPKTMVSIVYDLTSKKRNKLSAASVNAICVFKSALKARGETSMNMTIEEKHLSLMSSDKLYASATKETTLCETAL
ncbi:hypothetical protein ALC56_07715 [Trachymyrmex septentrionalis]|uniref:SCAN domain-containing protein 3 n=1 Tax=Trachymyrmex septentrionalis TaxID=34720 RepID=A0A151JVK5_9HYME|nr:PREDICTED: uncharacterized protein LOC108749770 isoform X1 [Trachymyrmex septentrionalis]KYN37919.1 hypothetical protein ALC56_07715 [Trachymyrmex septentrionalis]